MRRIDHSSIADSKRLKIQPLWKIARHFLIKQNMQILNDPAIHLGIYPRAVDTLLLLSRVSHVQLCATHRWQPTRLCRPWDSPGKNTGVGCHFLLQCMKVKSESEVAQSCLTLCDPMNCSPPGSSVHGIFQARVLEWGAIAFSSRHSGSHKNYV